MKSFKETISEAQDKECLNRTVPEAPGELKFYKRHLVKDILKKFRVKGCENVFNGTIVKTFNRKANHFGNDEKASIKAYESVDTSVETVETVDEARNDSEKLRHIFVDGKYVGSTRGRTSVAALKRWRQVHKGEGAAKAHVAQESEAVEGEVINEISKELLARYVNRSKDHEKEAVKKAKVKLTKKKFEESVQIDEKNWIAGAIKHPGALTRAAKAAGESNSEYEQQHKDDSGKAGERSRLAIKLKGFRESEQIEIAEVLKRFIKKPHWSATKLKPVVKEVQSPVLGDPDSVDKSDVTPVAKVKSVTLAKPMKSTVAESLSKDSQKNFADSKGKMKPSDAIDKKTDKVKAMISKMREKK